MLHDLSPKKMPTFILMNSKRQKRIDVFVEQNYALCKSNFFQGLKPDGHRTPNGVLLVKAARIELEYSPNTNSTDIYRTLFNSYFRQFGVQLSGCTSRSVAKTKDAKAQKTTKKVVVAIAIIIVITAMLVWAYC